MVRPRGIKEKIRRKYKHCFSKQFLEDHGVKIYRGDEQILNPVGHLYDIKLPNTRYYVGDQFVEAGEVQKVTSYEVLRNLGFVLTSRRVRPDEKWQAGQMVVYELKRAYEGIEHIGKFPPGKYGVHAEYDSYHKVARVIGPRCGPMGAGPWVPVEERSQTLNPGRKTSYKGYGGKKADILIDRQIRSWLGIDQEKKPIFIPEAAFMITDANEIVCFPNSADMPSILICGLKGCLAEGTLIDMPRDMKKYPEGIPIEQLVGKEEFYVYSINPGTKKIELKKAGSCELVGEKEVFEVELTTGQKIQATAEHPFLMMDGTYKDINDFFLAPAVDPCVRLTSEKKVVPGIIRLIKPLGVCKVYDIYDVEDNHNYIANGFCVSNSGKSYCLHSLVSRFFWKPSFDYKIAILNDSSRETGTWCFPNSDPDQIYMLKRLNERPLPLPCVYLHPKVKEDYETLYMGSVGHFITIPFREIVENHKEYLKIEGSVRYFTKFKEQLRNCTTQEEAEALLETISLSHQVPPNTANKIRAEFETLFDTKMTDISSEKQHPWSVSKTPSQAYNPLTACIHAGVLPVLETEFVSNMRELLSIYFTYFVKDLFMRQKQDVHFAAERSQLLLVVDECFVGSTLISTSIGAITISRLYQMYTKKQPLPMARSYHLDKKEYVLRPIEKVIRKDARELVELRFVETPSQGVSKIKCTPNHKILTPSGYVKAEDLGPGDIVCASYDRGFTKVKSVKRLPLSPPFSDSVPVYDLTVTETHNFVVCSRSNLKGVLAKNCHNISQRGQFSGADLLLRRCVREGRPRRIGTLLATQKFGELPDVIKDNTTYLICFKNPGEASLISNQYKMGKDKAQMITDLGKHECLAYTTEQFVIYDSSGRRRKSKPNEVFKGKTLPPYSMHKRPKSRAK